MLFLLSIHHHTMLITTRQVLVVASSPRERLLIRGVGGVEYVADAHAGMPRDVEQHAGANGSIVAFVVGDRGLRDV